MSSSLDRSVPSSAAGGAQAHPGGDLYALLGVTPFEPNADLISARVRNLMREARKYQLGPHAARTQAQLDDLAAAAACLLDPQRKQAYDDVLRERYGLQPLSVRSTYRAAAIPDDEPNRTGPAKASTGAARTLIPLLVTAAVVVIAFVVLTNAPAPRNNASGGNGPTSDATAAERAGPPRAGDEASAIPPRERAEPSKEIRLSENHPTSVPGSSAQPIGEATGSGPRLPVAGTGAQRADPAPPGRMPAAAPWPGAEARTSAAGSVAGAGAAAGPERDAPAQARQTRSHPTQAAHAEHAAHASDPGVELHLTPAEVLKELKDLRLRRTVAGRVATDARVLSTERILSLVHYGWSKFDDDRQFQAQLEREVIAIKRIYPQLRQPLSQKP